MTSPEIEITKTEVLSNNWYTLRKLTYNYRQANGDWEKHQREVYDRGNGAVILLYNTTTKNVVLTHQFRIPTYTNGNETGMMIEACAGMLDEDNPADCVIRETEEETGYKISEVKKVFEAFMSPGAVTEILYFFIGEYSDDMKVSDGGGLASEHENIEVLEMPFTKAIEMMDSGEIKDAKTMLLLQYAQLHNLMAF
jgi:GDP-mannose pyrophosphatase NudK